MTGNAVPVFTGKKPGPKILTAWAEQERQDAKAAAKEAEYWGNVGAIEIDLDTLDLTPKPALSPDHPGYEARERENAKLVDLADWRENARGRSIYQNSTEYEERERQIAEDCEWRALTEKLVIVYDDGDEPFEDTTARDMLPEIRRELELLNQPEIVAERNAHIRVTNKTGKMVHEEIGIDGKVVRKTCDVGGIRHEISVEKCIDDLAAFDHYTREDGIDSDLIEAVIAPLLDMACEHVKGDVQDAFRAACDAYTAELAAPKQRKATAKTGLPAELRVVDAYLRKIDGPVSTHNLKSGLRGLIKRNHLEGDEQAQNRLVEGLAAHEHIALGKVPARQMVARAVREVIAENKPKRKQDSIAIVNEWSDPDMADWSQNNLASATDLNGDPRVYDYEGDVCDMHNRQRRMLSEKQFAAINNNVNKYAREKQDGERRGEFAPKPVIDHNFHRSDKPYPELKEVKSAPFFTNDGRRVGDHGYDEPAKTYLDLGGLEVPPVSDVPSDEDTTKAKELFFEMIGDFPFDGVADREECEARFLRNEGAPLPSAAHAVCLILERAARDLINGPTPVYAPTKPKPGTGAGALVGAITLAATGCKAAAESMPATDEEYTKVMSANISESGEYVFFDNMNAALTLGTFASNVTEGRVRARLLGSSRMIEAVRCGLLGLLPPTTSRAPQKSCGVW